jgi:hypothetical protein
MAKELSPPDNGIFEEDRRLEFDLAIITQAELFVDSCVVIDRYQDESDPDVQAAKTRDFEQSGQADKLKQTIGETLAKFTLGDGESITLEPGIAGMSIVAIPSVSDEEYSIAIADKERSEQLLTTYVIHYQKFLEANLKDIYEDSLVREVKSWETAWKKIQSTLHPLGGTTLIEIADFFDGLVELEYPSFDDMDKLRGAAARLDSAASTFYEIFNDHLGRAIQRRSKSN